MVARIPLVLKTGRVVELDPTEDLDVLERDILAGTSGRLLFSSDTPVTRVAAGRIAVDGDELAKLEDLASTSSGKGATLVGIFDTDAYFTGATVEAVTKELFEKKISFDITNNLTVGMTATAYDGGTQTSGSYTPAPANGNLQRYINGGAHTLAPPSASNDYTIIIQITNNGSAGAITTSGYTKVSGDAFTTTNGHDFLCFITKLNGFTHLFVQALQ